MLNHYAVPLSVYSDVCQIYLNKSGRKECGNIWEFIPKVDTPPQKKNTLNNEIDGGLLR